MQITLVAYYGTKPVVLVDFIKKLQNRLSLYFSHAFQPYPLESVHGTIIGMEGIASEGAILNRYFHDLRCERRPMDLDGAVRFIRTTDILPLQIRMGGFKENERYPFTSRGMSPYHRSFSIQGESAVAMGWPVTTCGTYSGTLHKLRWQFQQYNILHRYLRNEDDMDNDFYLVLGKLAPGIKNKILLQEMTERLRSYIAARPPILIPLGREHLSIISYTNDTLPETSSVAFQITDESVDGQLLRRQYTSP